MWVCLHLKSVVKWDDVMPCSLVQIY